MNETHESAPPAVAPCRPQKIDDALVAALPSKTKAKMHTVAAGGIGYVIYLIILAARPRFFPTLTDELAELVAGALAIGLPVVWTVIAHNRYVADFITRLKDHDDAPNP